MESQAGSAAVTTPIADATPSLPALVRALRLHQWAKNALLFLPILAAHHLDDRAALLRVVLGFLSFGLVASSVYVLNDLVDVESDRSHPRKRLRPFASGALRLGAGFALVPGLLAAGAGVALLLPPMFGVALTAYWFTTLAYSLRIKRVVVLDVLVLAALYTVRIYAGAFAAGVPVSEWLASFALFFFLSLAILKRASELAKVTQAVPGRGYRPDDRVPVSAMGVASGYVSVLVLALYVTSQDVRRLYTQPAWLWMLCVLVLYWISRMWLLAWRGEVDDDPVVFAIRDPASWAVAVLGAAVIRLGT
jgi:4-hydroxybenzoate polyprenyltransferase